MKKTIVAREETIMPSNEMSRRVVFGVGGAALTAAALLAQSGETQASTGEASEAVVRAWYEAWKEKDWDRANALSTDDFTFTSPNDDDHISKATFKKRCWDTQIGFVKSTDLELVMAKGDDVLVKYNCVTTNGKSFRNVEWLHVRNGQIASLQCFFGGKMTFPSSVSKQ